MRNIEELPFSVTGGILCCRPDDTYGAELFQRSEPAPPDSITHTYTFVRMLRIVRTLMKGIRMSRQALRKYRPFVARWKRRRWPFRTQYHTRRSCARRTKLLRYKLYHTTTHELLLPTNVAIITILYCTSRQIYISVGSYKWIFIF